MSKKRNTHVLKSDVLFMDNGVTELNSFQIKRERFVVKLQPLNSFFSC